MGLNQRLLDSIRDAEYIEPTPIQAKAIPISMEGQDVLGLAQTGTGKTAAFILPILDKIQTDHNKSIKALVIAPTRELVDQINKTAVDLGKYTKSRSTSIYGGVNKRPQDSKLSRHPDIVVACPGRLLDHLNQKTIDLSRVETLVLDEADTMCDMGFLPDIRKILNHLPVERQTLFFAATMPNDIRALAKDILKSPRTVQIGIISPAETVAHALYPMNEKIKTKCLFKVLETTATGRVIVFTRTKHRAKRLGGDLDNKGYKVAVLQGNLSQNKRNMSINGFKNGKYDILVATDIASRGIDVSEVSHVINFDIPNTVDAYIHRIGRTGRAKQKGEALTFVVPDDEFMVRKIENILKAKIDRRTIDDIDYGKTDVSGSRSSEYRGSGGGSRQKRQRKGRYNGASKAIRGIEEGKSSSKSHRYRKKSGNHSVNSIRDAVKTSSGKRPRSR
ncbi:MAG: RNA helicase [Dehalococcoidia bacterium]|nr:RNA helicase [Dehalococcoidia bacterium]|tara:strand:- start:73 stop:1413 length:1341 start_codon:yes stop_codon:yes gene_type:complete